MFVASCWRQTRFVHFRFVADAFLRRMVRMIVGTLVRIGSGALVIKTITRLLQGDRSIFAGPAVPAHGLYLVRIRY
jgi:tRNA pseudouridine38-40 synthase